MIKAIAIDDEPPALRVVENFCARIDFINLQKTFTKPTDALKYLNKFPVDLLFLDINMPSLSGINLYKTVRQNTLVIFTTAYSEYAVEGFNLNAVDFLLKPFAYERFLQATKKAKEYFDFHHQSKDAVQKDLYIRADYSLIKIKIDEILYIEGLDDYLKIHLPDRNPVVTRMTMKTILADLPTKEFIRVHRSFIVPFRQIISIRNKVIKIAGVEIPVGKSYEKDFTAFIKDKGAAKL